MLSYTVIIHTNKRFVITCSVNNIWNLMARLKRLIAVLSNKL